MLVLKPGAQVMLLKNISVSQGLVNGSRGVVDPFVKDPEVGISCFVESSLSEWCHWFIS